MEAKQETVYRNSGLPSSYDILVRMCLNYKQCCGSKYRYIVFEFGSRTWPHIGTVVRLWIFKNVNNNFMESQPNRAAPVGLLDTGWNISDLFVNLDTADSLIPRKLTQSDPFVAR